MSGGSGVVHNEFNQHLLFNQQVFPESGLSGEQERPILFTAILQHQQCPTQSTCSVHDPEFMTVHSNNKTTK